MSPYRSDRKADEAGDVPTRRMITHFLTIEDGRLYDYAGFGSDRTPIDSEAKLEALFEGGDDVACSSSIDFPEEHTADPQVLALVALLGRS